MTFQEWQPQWARLAHFHISADQDRSRLEAEWFAQLRHLHVDAVDAGITLLIGHAKDNFLPGLGLLKDYIGQRMRRYDRQPGTCDTCGGSGWLEAPAFRVGPLVYSNNMSRCQDCGIPAPKVEIHKRREPLSDLERHEYAAGRYGRDQMPDGLKAKPWHPEARAQHTSAMRTMFDALKVKLFGSRDDAA